MHLCTLPKGLTFPAFFLPESLKIISLPFSNPQFICMTAICILLEIHVYLLWFLKAIMKEHQKLSSHNPQSENFNTRMKSRWQNLFWWPSLLYSRCFFSVQIYLSGFHCGHQEKREEPASLEHCYLKCSVWSDSQATVQRVINVSRLCSSVSLRGSDIGTLCMQTEIISWDFLAQSSVA